MTTKVTNMNPALSFNFVSSLSLDPQIQFVRNSVATYFDASGVMQTASTNAARFDHNPVTGESLGLLIEEQRTNSLTGSEDFDWATKTGITVTTNAVVAPDGTQTADKLVATAVTSAHEIRRTFTFTQNATYSISAFFKAAGYECVVLNIGGTNFVAFNLLTGDVNAAVTGSGWANTAGQVQAVGGGWFRCVITSTRTGVDLSTSFRVYISDVATNTAGAPSFTGDGSSGIYPWGGQLEIGSSPSSYIPTTTTALTRNADVATITGTNFSSFWQASKGGVLVRARPGTVSGTRPLVQFDDNTADNIIALRGNTTNPELYIKATTDQAAIDAGTIAANTSYRLAGTWATNDCAANLNGAAPVLDTSATIPAVTQMRLGSDGTNYLNGHIEAVEYYDQRLLNFALQVASSSAGYRSIVQPIINNIL
jgi:hypothetical protein